MEVFKRYEIPTLKEEERKEKKKYSKEWLSKSELDLLFKPSTGVSSRDLLLMKVCYSGALRVSEALNSRLEDYKNEDEQYFLLLYDQKTDKINWEKQPITAPIFGEIGRFCRDNKIKSQDYIFRTQKSERMTYNRAYIIVKECAKKVGITKQITTHTFRRSRASHLLDDGVDIAKVSAFLRHKNIATTMKYLKISKKVLYDMIAEVDKKFDFL